MMTVTVHEAKTNLSRLIAKALAGEEVIIAKGREPAVRLVAIERARPARMPARLKGRISVPDTFFDPMPAEELARWSGAPD